MAAEFRPKRILLPTDLSEASLTSINLGLKMADQFGSMVDVLSVFEEYPRHLFSNRNDFGEEVAGRISQQLHRALTNVSVSRQVKDNIRLSVRQGKPSEQIRMMVRKNFNDLIIMVTHGRQGLERLRYGSVTEAVVRTVPIDVLALKPDPAEQNFRPASILVPLDFSRRDAHALSHARQLQQIYQASAHVVHVVPTVSLEKMAFKPPQDVFDSSRERLQREASRSNLEADVHVLHGDPSDCLVGKIKELGVDLVLLPARQKSDRLLGMLGSVSSKLVRHAPCNVLTMHPK